MGRSSENALSRDLLVLENKQAGVAELLLLPSLQLQGRREKRAKGRGSRRREK